MDADGIVSVLVGVLRVHTLGQWGEGVSQTLILLQLLLLLRCELTVALDILEALVDINISGCLVEQRTTGIELSLHAREHIIDSGEVDDLITKLLALLGISQTLVVSLLLNTYALCSDTQTGAVHQSHYVLDQTQTGATAEFCLCVLISELTGW